MGERIVRNDEVAGSIPVISTNQAKNAHFMGFFHFGIRNGIRARGLST